MQDLSYKFFFPYFCEPVALPSDFAETSTTILGQTLFRTFDLASFIYGLYSQLVLPETASPRSEQTPF